MARRGKAWQGRQQLGEAMSNRQLRKAREDVQAALAKLNKERNGLRPSEVVAAAKPKASPLHNEFEWNDAKAGEEYRLEQARRLIRVCVTTFKSEDGETIVDPYIHVPATKEQRDASNSGEGVYLPLSVVVQDVDQFARALSALMTKLNAAKAAAEELRAAAQDGKEPERMVRIAMAITALETAGAAVAALH
jgi:hypothetical protein